MLQVVVTVQRLKLRSTRVFCFPPKKQPQSTKIIRTICSFGLLHVLPVDVGLDKGIRLGGKFFAKSALYELWFAARQPLVRSHGVLVLEALAAHLALVVILQLVARVNRHQVATQPLFRKSLVAAVVAEERGASGYAFGSAEQMRLSGSVIEKRILTDPALVVPCDAAVGAVSQISAVVLLGCFVALWTVVSQLIC